MNNEHEGPRPEPGIGGSLQNAREGKGLTLRQVEERTKIRARYLKDLERENFDVLPAVYVLGSLKTYADHLGLNGEALSAELKSRLQPDEPHVFPEEPTETENPRDTEDEYEAAPLLTVGFDYLFLGAGIVLISTFAVMTLVFALATRDGPAVSQLREPAMPEAPSEIALAGNVLEEPARQPGNEVAAPKPESEADDDQDADRPDPSKDDEDRTEQEPENASSQTSFFGDVKFVRVSPASTPTAAATAPAASASASPQASASASAGSVPSGSAPPADVPVPDAPATDLPAATATGPAATAAPASTAPASASPASAAPASAAPAASAPADSTPAASAAPAPASAAPAPAPGAPASAPATGGSGPEPGSVTFGPRPAPTAGASGGMGPRQVEPGGPDAAGLAGRIADRVGEIVDPVR